MKIDERKRLEHKAAVGRIPGAVREEEQTGCLGRA